MIKRVFKWLANFLSCILFILLLLAIYGKVSVLVSDNPYPNYFGYTIFQIASGSMEPALYKDDVILVKISKDNLQKDDRYDNQNLHLSVSCENPNHYFLLVYLPSTVIY